MMMPVRMQQQPILAFVAPLLQPTRQALPAAVISQAFLEAQAPLVQLVQPGSLLLSRGVGATLVQSMSRALFGAAGAVGAVGTPCAADAPGMTDNVDRATNTCASMATGNVCAVGAACAAVAARMTGCSRLLVPRLALQFGAALWVLPQHAIVILLMSRVRGVIALSSRA